MKCELCFEEIVDIDNSAIASFFGEDLKFCSKNHCLQYVQAMQILNVMYDVVAKPNENVIRLAIQAINDGIGTEQWDNDKAIAFFWNVYCCNGSFRNWTICGYRDYAKPVLSRAKLRRERSGTPNNVIEVGYGPGTNYPMYRDVDRVVGVDISEYMLNTAETHENLEKLCHNIIYPFPFEDDEFEIGISIKTMQHILPQDIKSTVKNFVRVCKNVLLIETSKKDSEMKSGFAFIHKNLKELFIDEGMYLIKEVSAKQQQQDTIVYYFSKKPLVSVIIPSKDQKQFLKRAIDSALDQNYDNVEVIVVDSSIDDSPEILKEYGDKITTFYEPASGLAHARNTGMKLALGDFLIFLDSDDAMKYDRVKRQLEVFKDFPDAGCVYTAMQMVDKDNKTISVAQAIPFNVNEWLPGQYVGISTCMFSREVIDHVRFFDENFKMCEDSDYLLRLAANKFPLIHLNEALTIYTIHDDSMTKKVYTMNKEYTKFIVKHKIPMEMALSRIQKFNNPQAIYAITDGYREGCAIWGDYPQKQKGE